MRSRPGFGAVLVVGCLVLAPRVAIGQGGETVGMITEIKAGRGKAEVKAAAGSTWRPAGPLLALRAGDAVRATEDASVVVLLTGGRGTVKVGAASSPFVAGGGAPGESKLGKARTLVEGSLRYLSSSAKEAPTAVLSVRGGSRPPVILAPRGGPVLPGPIAFEWLGSQFSRYTVRVTSPSGVLLERKGIAGSRYEYPPDAPPLAPGVAYTVQVLAMSQPPQEAHFEVLEAGRAQSIRQNLKSMEETLGSSVSPTTLAVLEAGFLADEGLIHDARLAIVAALAKDPDEPTLHVVLGNLYVASGLSEQAAESFDEAQFLLSGDAR